MADGATAAADAGNERRLLLLHGGGVGPWMWDGVIAALPTSLTVLTPTLPGHGDRARPQFTTLAAAAAGVAADLELGARRGPLTVAGFSLEGQVALHLAAAHPDLVERLVIISSLLKPVAGASAAARLVRLSAPLAARPWFARLQARQLGVPARLFDSYLRTAQALTPESLASLTYANSTFDAEPLLARYGGPTVYLAGAREPGAVLRGARAVADGTLEVRTVPGVGHTLPLTDPELVARVLMTPAAR